MSARLQFATGARVGYLIVIGEAEPTCQPSGRLRRRVLVFCTLCGNTKEMAIDVLRPKPDGAVTLSCGCYRRQRMRSLNRQLPRTPRGHNRPANYSPDRRA